MKRAVPIKENEDYNEIIQKLDDQWRALPMSLHLLPESITKLQYSNDDPDVLWSYLKKYGKDLNEFQELSDFALAVLCLPVSNADCERVFSDVNNIKTKSRNKLLTNTINGNLLIKQCVKGGHFETNCINFTPTKPMFDKMTSSVLYSNATQEPYLELDIFFGDV